jgi:hypothetical protein
MVMSEAVGDRDAAKTRGYGGSDSRSGVFDGDRTVRSGVEPRTCL